MSKSAQEFETVWQAHVEDDVVWSPAGARRGHRFTPDGPIIPPVLPPVGGTDADDAAPVRRPNRLIATMVALALIAGVAGAGVAASRRTSSEQPALSAQPIPTAPTVPAPAASTPES